MPEPIHCSSCDAKIDGYVPFMREDDDNLYCDNCWDLLQDEASDYSDDPDC